MIENLREQLVNVENIPSLPMIVQDILQVTEDPKSGVKDVQEVVERDQSCAVKLLKLSNSAYYGFSRQITTVKQAIVIIGLEGVKSAAMSLSMAGCFKEGARDQQQVLSDLWAHSMATATAAQMLAKKSKATSEAVAYCAGLTHDFGKVILAGHFGVRYLEMFRQAREEKVPITLLEQSEFGVDHETVANWIAEAWDLPDEIREIAKSHHSGFRVDQTNKGILLVGIADALAYAAKVGHGGNGRPPVLDGQFLKLIGLDSTVGNEVVVEIKKQADRFSALLQLAD
jgi:putative nucleotidyltransferase with HDIG domain